MQGQTLSTSPGSWTGATPLHYDYQWQRSGRSVPGATATSYALSSYDVGYRIDVVVTASNSVGSTSATSASTAPVSSSSSGGGGTPPPPPTPAVTAISPSSGPEAGGTSVAITGSSFDTATAVRFGSSGAVGFTVNSASSITATSPAGSGVVDVTVTNSGGSSASGSADRFSYLTSAPPPPPLPAGAAGEVHFVKKASSSFDSEDIEANGAWIREHFARMVTWSPFFDSRTSWYPNAWDYQDAYAIYVSSALAKEHPEWILKDAQGEPLYIPWGNPPTQYAADLTNPAFRRYWIERTKAILAHGYRGVFIDDVDMWANVANYKLEKKTPISGVTGQAISDERWREYFASFLTEVRAALPGYEIADNSVWYAGALSANRGTTNPLVRSQVEHADVINLERGANDSGLTGGTGNWSLYNLLAYIDEVHALGRSVVLDGNVSEVAAMEYNLAAYLLISTGHDYVEDGGSTQNTKSFWPDWEVNLGEASGPRERSSSGLWKRSFTGGVVYLLEPGAAAQTITLPAPMKSTRLGRVSSITLSPRQAAVLVR